jgi:L-threonylcarbamoyladenylate synthase
MVEEIPETAKKLIDYFWPGPLTIIFKASRNIPRILTANTDRIGIRISSNRIINNILERLNLPITSTSANISGMDILESPDDIFKNIGRDIDLIIDGGKVCDKRPSTVIDISCHKIIREGIISKNTIESLLGRDINLVY